MDDKDKSIIDKILKIAGVDACAISSIDGEVLRFDSKDNAISVETIGRVSSEISKLFASYSISSVDITSLCLNFQDQNIILNGFGSGFIFIVSRKNSNVNLLKLETSYLESEFVKIVNQSVEGFSGNYSKSDENKKGMDLQSKQSNDMQDSFLGDTQKNFEPLYKIIQLDKLNSIKNIFSSSLGPISAMLFDEKIKELNEDVNNFNAENIEDLINLLSLEIEEKSERLDFVKAAKKVIQ